MLCEARVLTFELNDGEMEEGGETKAECLEEAVGGTAPRAQHVIAASMDAEKLEVLKGREAQELCFALLNPMSGSCCCYCCAEEMEDEDDKRLTL